MSLILKGIDMPKDAEYFSVTFYKKGAYRKEKIMDISEAIQIPKGHGRLIDGDETRTQYYQTMDELLQSTTINISAEALSLLCGLTLINNAPTILETEE